MNQREYSSDSEFGMAIAAAAYAISLQEGGSTQTKRISFEGPETSLPRTKTRTEDNKIKLTNLSGSFKRWFTDKETNEGEESAVSGGSFTRKPATAGQPNIEDTATNHNITQKAMGSTPSVKKKPTLTDNHLNDTGIKRVESGKDMRSGSRAPSTRKPAMTSFDNKIEDGNLGGKNIAKADAWEKAKMIKIKNRYDKMINLIVGWEKEKKAKAKHSLELKGNEPEHKRARALQKYNEEIPEINRIAGEALAMAEDKKRNDEAKTREKARKIRLTGKIPRTCCSCI